MSALCDNWLTTMTESYIPSTEYNGAVITFAAASGIDPNRQKIAGDETFDLGTGRAGAVRASKTS
jgi:hypothetical protein